MRSYYDPYVLSDLRRRVLEGLERRNWIAVEEDILVRIPHRKEVENRIYMHQKEHSQEVLVDLIYETWYDKDTKQSRNRKARIGTISPFVPEAMIINENYEKYFDLETGKLLRPLKDMEEAKPKGNPKPAKETPKKPETPPSPAPEKTEEEDNAWVQDLIRDVQSVAEEMRQEELEKKIRGDEAERHRELFGDSEAGREVEIEEAQKRLEAIFLHDEIETTDQQDIQEGENETEEYTAPDNAAGTASNVGEDEYRLAVLNQILKGILESIRNLAKKKPDAIVNTYKAQSINRILEEIKTYYQGSDYEDLLTLVEEPGEEEHDGRVILTGMTYSDVEVLLEKYIAIVRFIRHKST